jgi:uncharacterized protein YndB with AHSA1/START domain
MATVQANAQRSIPAPPAAVFGVLADPARRREILPEAYHDVAVTAGDDGQPRVTYTLHAAGRQRDYRIAIRGEQDGQQVLDTDELSSLRTTWSLRPDGTGTAVTVTTSWQGAAGIGGFFERTFAPKGVARLHQQTLERLESVLRG